MGNGNVKKIDTHRPTVANPGPAPQGLVAASRREVKGAYRALFRTALDGDAIADIRLAVNQNQALGNRRFHGRIEKATGERREARPRGRPRKAGAVAGSGVAGVQGDLGI